MKKLILSFLTFLMALVFSQTGSTATIDLHDYAFNIDGTVSEALGPMPANVNLNDFDTDTGLGTVSITVTGTGDHFVGGFFDHEIDETTNTYFNEFGSTSGASAGSGQTWEIDEPGYVFGDIWTNFSNSNLDNTNNVPATNGNDVSMAMAWDFTLNTNEAAEIAFILSETIAADYLGFYLALADSNSDATIYLYSTLDIVGGEVPEPSTMILFGLGLMGLVRAGRRQN